MEPLRSITPTTPKQTSPSATQSLVRIPPWEVPNYWELAAPELERAIPYNNGESGMDDVWRSLVTGSNTLWMVSENNEPVCFFTTFIHDFEKKRVLFTSLLAGKGFDSFSRLEPQLCEYAIACRCKAIESFVIPSVSKIVARALPGFKITHHVMVKEL